MPLDLVHDEQAGSHWVRGIGATRYAPARLVLGFGSGESSGKFRRIFGGMIRAEMPVAVSDRASRTDSATANRTSG